MYRSVAYFSAPLRGAHIVGDEGEITVYDTTSRPVELHVRGHHVVVGAARPDGMHDTGEVWGRSDGAPRPVGGPGSLRPPRAPPPPPGAAPCAPGPPDATRAAPSVR